MQWRLTWVLVTMLLSMELTSRAGSRDGDNETGAVYRDALKCGPNSLFVFLMLLGQRNVALESLADIPMASDGTSLLSLREAALRFRINAEVRRYRPEDIDLVTLPAIVQVKNREESPVREHFIVIYRVQGAYVHAIDSTGERVSHLKASLPGYWTGYAMTKTRPLVSRVVGAWSRASSVLICGMSAFLLGYYCYRKGRKREAK